MRRRSGFLVALAFGLGLTTPGWGQTTLSPDEARLTAAQLLSVGQPRAALEILDALLLRDETDAASYIVSAHAYRTRGDLGAAHEAARKGWYYASRDDEKYGAALAAAQALSKMGQKSRAQLWLRRAAHVAPNDGMRQRAVRDYQFVRLTNPWSVHLSFGINPSDNVNNAPRNNTMVLGGLVFVDQSAVPVSGIEIEASARLRYNFNVSQTRRDFVSVSWNETQVIITDDDPPDGVDASNYSYRKLETTVGRDFKSGPDAPRRSVSASLGRIWYGGEHLSDEVKLSFSETHILDQGSALTWYSSLGYADRQDSALRSGTTTKLGTTWRRPIDSGALLSLNAELSRSDTDSAAMTHTGLILGATYKLGRETFGADTEFSLSTNFKRYDHALYGPDARSDDGITLSTSLFFKDFDTHGFAPKVTLSASRTNSNIDRFETQNFGLSIGFQSVF